MVVVSTPQSEKFIAQPTTYARKRTSSRARIEQTCRGFRHLPKYAQWGLEQRAGSRPISRVLSRVIIPLRRPSPNACSSLPGSHARTRRCEFPRDFPIWPCSRWGLPCHARYRPRGALLPHHFTLTRGRFPREKPAQAVSFCCTFRGLAPPRRYLAPCPKEPGLSSASREKCSDHLADSEAHHTPRWTKRQSRIAAT